MSYSGMQEAIDCQEDLTTAEWAVLVVLARHVNTKTGACFPSQSTIARKSRLSRQHVNICIKSLVNKGLVRVRPLPHRKRQYDLLFSKVVPFVPRQQVVI